MAYYGSSKRSKWSRPHARRPTRKGKDGMKGYARYAATGKGLSDVGYAQWVTKRAKEGKGTVIEHPASYLLGMAKIGTPVTWAGKPGYVGSELEARVKQAAVASRGMVGERTTTYAPTGIARAAMGGMGAGEWERPQVKKIEDKGAGLGTVVALGGVAAIAWMVFR